MAGDQSLTQQAGTVPTIKSQTILFLHLLGILNGVGMKLSMYLQGKRHICYRSFESFDLLLRKFEREKNDLDAFADAAAPGLSRCLSEFIELKLPMVD